MDTTVFRPGLDGGPMRALRPGPVIHPHHTLPSFYAAGDAFAMPCRNRRRGLGVEGPGIVCLETAASGLPVLAGGIGGAPDAVRDGETGYVVDGDPAAAAADRVTRFFRNPELVHTAGERARQRVQTKWTWDRSYATLTRPRFALRERQGE
nr:glycosyltransferase family 4 protein [Streptomyces sp. SS1-1]